MDVFCDRGAFTVEETKQVFSAAKKHNLPVRVHAEELEYTGIGKIAASEFNALSADHLLQATKNDFEVLAKYGTVATFMPLAPIGLFTNDIPTGWEESNVIIGLGSDFNPNNWVISMQLAIQMAVFRYKMRPIDALKAGTSGAYKAITGTSLKPLKKGTKATFVLLEGSSIEEICSKMGQNLVRYVYKDGKVLFNNVNRIC